MVVLLALTTSLTANTEGQTYSQYYHVINDSIFTDFQWIGQHTSAGRLVAMGEPTIAWAYPAVAGPGRDVFHAIASPNVSNRTDKLRGMLESGEVDVTWLRKSGVSVFYTCRPRTFSCSEMDNNDLFKVRRGVYVVPDSADTR